MNHAGLFFALATTLSWSIGIFPFTEAARRLGVNSLNHLRLLIATVLLFICSALLNASGLGMLFSEKYFHAWIWLGLSGIVGLALGDYFAFKMYAILGARTGSVLTTFSPAAALVFGRFLLDEKINFVGISGMLITILGVISISFGKKERMKMPESHHGKVRNGVMLGILAALCQGIGLVLAKKGFLIQENSDHFLSPVNATFIRMSVSTLVLFSLTIISGTRHQVIKPVFDNKENGIKYAVAGTFFGPFLGVTLSLITISKLDVAVAQTIFSLVPAFALIISFVFYKEKITLQSFAGIIISILGVIILIWRNNILACILR